MSSKTLKPLVLAAGAVLIGSLAGSAFAMSPLSQGYQVAPGDDKPQAEGDMAAAEGDGKVEEEGKCGEGKCGEGSCGADKKAEGAAAGAAEGDGKAHEEGKCGEGSCGEDKKKEG
jgi:uncharacterized low-complexity protein